MSTITNSPQEVTNLILEARKSFSLGLWVKDDNGDPVDITDCTFNLTVAKQNRDGTMTGMIDKDGDVPSAVLGYVRFNLQADDLDLKPGGYYFTILMTPQYYSRVIVKGEVQLLQNTEFGSVAETYTVAQPSQAFETVLRSSSDIHVDLSTVLPPDVLHLPPGGMTGQALVKISNDPYDVAWGTLSGGLSGAGQTAGKAPLTDGAGSWSWQPVTQEGDWDDDIIVANAAQDVVIATKASTAYVDAQNTAQNNIIATKATTAYVDSENDAQDLVIATKQTAVQVAALIDAETNHINAASDLVLTGTGTASSPKTLSLPARLSTLGEQRTAVDFNTLTTTGWYRVSSATANAPTSDSWHYVEVIQHNSTYILQVAYPYFYANEAFMRKLTAGVWTSWTPLSGDLTGTTTIRNVTTSTYMQKFYDTTLDQWFVGNKTGGWRRFNGSTGWTASAWDTLQGSSGTALLAGRTINLTIPTVLETNEHLMFQLTTGGSGYTFIGGNAITRGSSSTTLTIRYMQLMSHTTQSGTIAWQVTQF